MKRNNRLTAILLVIALVISLCFTYAFATTGTVSKTLSYNNIKIKLNGTTITPKDANGNVVEPFIVEGTTYLPVRAVGTALGLDVGWDGSTKTVLLSSAKAPSAELSPAELFEQCSPSVVHIETNSGGGTGFFIEEDIVATNNHVISGAWSATVKTVDGQVFNVIEVVAKSSNPDLALLRVDGKGTPVTLNTDNAKVGSALYSIGAPLGIFPTMNTGIIANNRHNEDGTDFYLSNIPFLSGNSGGPIFDSNGEVIGIVVGCVTDGDNALGWIIKSSYLLEMDRSNPSELELPQANAAESYTLASSLKNAQVGQLVSLGRYEQDADPATTDEEILWIVAEKNGSELTLVSLYCLDAAPFMSNDDPVRWDNSYARKFLNEDFFNSAFNAAEQALIQTVTVKNSPNPNHGTDSGEDTADKVYLFSLEEAMEFYGITTCEETWYDGVYAQATPYAIQKTLHLGSQGVWLEIPDSPNCWWWLRSSGGNDQNAAEIGSGGYLSFNGCDASMNQRGLRPVIHIKVK